MTPACKPSLSDKHAYEIARTWAIEGEPFARAMFDAVAKEHRLKDHEALRLMDRVRYEYSFFRSKP